MVSFSCNTPTAPGKYSKTIPLYGKLKPRKTKKTAAKAAAMNLFLINRFFAVFLKAIVFFLAFFHLCQQLILDYPPERDEGNGQAESYHNGGFDGIGKTEIVEQNNGYSQETQNPIFFHIHILHHNYFFFQFQIESVFNLLLAEVYQF